MDAQAVDFNPLTQVILPYGGTLLVLAILAFVVYRVWRSRQMKLAIERAADLVVIQVLVPKETEPTNESERRKNFQETMAIAEQFFASLSAIAALDKKFLDIPPTLSFEIIAKDAIRFYVAFPSGYRDLVEKQILSYYPSAAIELSPDFRIFSKELVGAGVEVKTTKRFVLPIKTYKELESDPINAVTEAFAKLGEQSHGALQVLIRPAGNNWQHQVFNAAKALQEGKPPTMLAGNWFGRLAMVASSGASDALKKKDEITPVKLTPMQEEVIKDLNEKSSKVGYQVQIRAIVMAPTKNEAEANLATVASAFAQFQSPRGNSFTVRRVKDFSQMAKQFILRNFTGSTAQILNTEEVASFYHFPNRFTETPKIQWLLARSVAPPINLPTEGIILGKSIYRGEEKMVRLKLNDRRRHMYMIGKTGVGKSTLLTHMFMQDVREGRGAAIIDPNGDVIEDILALIPPERMADVVLFDPSDTEWPMGMNMLEWKRPEDRDFLIAEWLEIFYKLFDPNRTGMVGPQFEHWGRNASLTVMAIPGGGTLLDIPRLFVDDAFREYCISYVTDPVVRAFWEQQFAKTNDFHKSEMYNYFISKFGRFMTNDLVRNIIGQTKSAFDFREIMDSGKIFLINLSKGKMGEMNSNLLGMILVSKLQVAAFQRADIPEEQRKDFFLYIDEFQNFTTGSIKTVLSEARKYRLGLNITNQYIAQLPEDIRDAVVGNAGTLLAYRVGADDAEFLEKEFPGVHKEDLTNLTMANLYVKLLIDGTPSKPFSMRGIREEAPRNHELAETIRQLVRVTYGQPLAQVEAQLGERLLPSNAIQEPQAVDGLKLA